MTFTSPLVDIGANLTHDSFHSDLPTVIRQARSVGVLQMVVTGASFEGSVAATKLADDYPETLTATAGVHPHHAKDWTKQGAKELYECAQHPKIVAAGECGLDYFRNFSTPEEQAYAFEAQLDMAADLKLPVFLHQRESIKPFLDILDRYLDKLPKAVAHCFTDTESALDALLERDLYVGITGWICDERRGHHLRDLVGRIPANRLMIETDAPYLLPRDLKPKPKSRRNEPRFLPHIAKVVAECVDKSPDQLALESTTTAREFFGLEAT
ncbi:MAG: TatD family hydrolase [Gammaproteobacteria bacterium]